MSRSRGQTSDNKQEIAVQFVYSKQQKMKKTFYFKNDKGKLLVEVIIFTFLDRVATVDVLTASNTDVKLSELELYILRD